MTRNTAREIATHLAYELSFTDLPIQEFLDQQLSRENFAARAEECGLYADTPNDKQEKYIRRLVSGVAEHAAELDAYIEQDIPHGVAISEAVNIAKDYESPEVVKFINGILGSFLRAEVKE